MDDELIVQFTAITDTTPSQAEQYLRLTEGNLEQAIQLFFEDPGLATAAAATASSSSSHPAPVATSTRKRKNYGEDEQGVIHIDDDDDDDDDDEEDQEDSDDVQYLGESSVAVHGPDTAEDAEIARRLQEELYSGTGQDPDGVRAPIERVRETLVGGDDFGGEFDDDTVSAMIQEQIRARQRRHDPTRASIFNQRDMQSSVWADESNNPDARARQLSYVTGGASDRSSRANTLAEMFRPPFEIISRLSWDEAREEGKDQQKWILVNVQDASIFDCQVLNRDLWKDKDVMETIKENFIFLQYSKADPRGTGYLQYYFANFQDDQNAYPHIAIVDPRTGEQVKVWSGPPPPKKEAFLEQVYEFLDRYSLDADSRNPVAKRKAERKDYDVDRMTEDQMLEIAMQNSLAPNAQVGPAHEDPDELTKSITMDRANMKAGEASTNGTTSLSPFAAIPSDRPHAEPPNDPTSTTRIQFRYSGGRTVRRFTLDDPVQRIYEWLKAEPLEGKEGQEFDLMLMGKNLINSLDQTIGEAGLKNASVMVEFAGGEE